MCMKSKRKAGGACCHLISLGHLFGKDVIIITSSICNCEGRFSGEGNPPHWSCSAVFQIHRKGSERRMIIKSGFINSSVLTETDIQHSGDHISEQN